MSGALLIAISAIVALYLQPIALIPAALGIMLNIVYEYAKGYGILGNIAFGLMIATCTAFGFLAADPYSITCQPLHCHLLK